MEREPAAQLVWYGRRSTSERHVTIAENHVSMSLCVSEISVLACTDPPMASAPAYPELELGAHVAHLRALPLQPGATRESRSPVPPSPQHPSYAALGRS